MSTKKFLVYKAEGSSSTRLGWVDVLPRTIGPNKGKYFIDGLRKAIATETKYDGDPTVIKIFKFDEKTSQFSGEEINNDPLDDDQAYGYEFKKRKRDEVEGASKRKKDEEAAQGLAGMYNAVANANLEDIKGYETASLKLMKSAFGWPAEPSSKLCFVRESIVSIVEGFLNDVEQNILIVGQRGIGKSFAGGYAVNQCLKAGHKVVVYVVRDSFFVFLADQKEVHEYDRKNDNYIHVCSRTYTDSILIYDCEQDYPQPPTGKFGRTICLSSPNVSQYEHWKKATAAASKYVDVWSNEEIKAACIALQLDETEVMQRQDRLGPIPRHIFEKRKADERTGEVAGALGDLKRSTDVLAVLVDNQADKSHPSHKLMMMVLAPPGSSPPYFYRPCSRSIIHEVHLIHQFVEQRANDAFLQLILKCDRGWQGTTFEQLYAPQLRHNNELSLLLQGANLLTAPATTALPTNFPSDEIPGVQLKSSSGTIPLADDTLYWSSDKQFPVFDWFIKKGGHLIGLQFTVAEKHGYNATSVGKLYNAFEDAFGTGTWTNIQNWSIVFVQRPIDEPMCVAQQVVLNFTQKTTAPFVPKHLRVAATSPHTQQVGEWNKFANAWWEKVMQYQAVPPKK